MLLKLHLETLPGIPIIVFYSQVFSRFQEDSILQNSDYSNESVELELVSSLCDVRRQRGRVV